MAMPIMPDDKISAGVLGGNLDMDVEVEDPGEKKV